MRRQCLYTLFPAMGLPLVLSAPLFLQPQGQPMEAYISAGDLGRNMGNQIGRSGGQRQPIFTL